MTRNFIGGATLAVAAGLLFFTLAPTCAAPAADGESAVEQTAASTKPVALTKAKKTRVNNAGRSRKAAKVAGLKADKAKQSRKTTQAANAPEPPMPASVANANALMQTPDAHGAAAIAGSPPLEAAAAEQLTELGKSLTAPVEEPRQMAQLSATDPSPTVLAQTALPLASAEPTRPLKQARITSSDDAWTQSSLIGKLFIAIGGMLTLASAARMLVA